MSAWTELTLLEQLQKKGCPDITALKIRAYKRIINLEAWNKEMYENHKAEIAELKHKLEEYNMPSKTEKQRRAMRAAAAGRSTLGIPKKVGKEFVKADKGKKKKR